MKKYLILLTAMLFSVTNVYASDDHGHEEEHYDTAEISEQTAHEVGIKELQAQSQTIDIYTKVNGSVVLNQNATAKIKARFPGVIKSIGKTVGDKVLSGETIATIESNESLQIYSVKSPISGVVMERNLNIGDEASEEPIMIIADLSKLWAEVYVFSKDSHVVKQGQKVVIRKIGSKLAAESIIQTILPYAEHSSQTLVARAVIDNRDDVWKPGYTVKVDIVTSQAEVPLAVRSSAIQKLKGNDVVFVKKGEGYESRTVKKGKTNDEWSEILSGIEAGDIYVAEGSFIIKAEIGKSSAEHDH